MSLSRDSARVFDAEAGHVGASLAGRNTYDDSKGIKGGTSHVDVPLVVLTHRPISDTRDRQTVITTGIEDAIAVAREMAGDKDVGLMGGNVLPAVFLLTPLVSAVNRCPTSSPVASRFSVGPWSPNEASKPYYRRQEHGQVV